MLEGEGGILEVTDGPFAVVIVGGETLQKLKKKYEKRMKNLNLSVSNAKKDKKNRCQNAFQHGF